jgi:hypothetical protein
MSQIPKMKAVLLRQFGGPENMYTSNLQKNNTFQESTISGQTLTSFSECEFFLFLFSFRYIGETERPPLKDSHSVLVQIKATALNRADILQRKGKYPPPPNESQILGLEMYNKSPYALTKFEL